MTTHGEGRAERASPPEPSHDSREAGSPSLTAELARLRAAVTAMHHPLAVPGAAQARDASRQLVARIDDYLVPRASRPEAALLVVVGGPTGGGKSTIVNSLARAPVSRTGVLRPTTRAPVLVCHPDDMPWFGERPLLPGLTRTSALQAGSDTLHLVSAPGLPAGLALLDAPDVDSVVEASPRDLPLRGGLRTDSRTLAERMLSAADLWLFVTTAARYADAVPWAALRAANERGTAVAMVLNRVPAGAEDEVTADFGALLDAHGMGHVTLFVLPEMPLSGQGMIADRLIGPLRDWLGELVAPAARAAVVEAAMSAALAGTGALLRRLAGAADDQVAAAQVLHQEVRGRYEAAEAALAEALRDGSLLRGEVLAACQELTAADGKLPDERLTGALTGALGNLIYEIVLEADEQVREAWCTRPEGRALLESGLRALGSGPPALESGPAAWESAPATPMAEPQPVGAGTAVTGGAGAASGAVTAGAVTGLVRDWEREVSDLSPKPGVYRLLVTLALLDGAAQVPRAFLAGQAGPELVERARSGLLERVRRLLAAHADRYHALVDAEPVDAERAAALRDLARGLGEGRAVPESAPT